MEKTAITGNTYRTSDYSIFTRLEGNRAVLQIRVNRILKSINKYGYIYNPIVVNEHYQIIDGQGRLEALAHLQMPVDFVISPGAGLKECVALNASGTSWTIPDYVDSYCELGIVDYIRLRQLLNDFPDIRPQTVFSIASGHSGSPNDDIKNGTFVLPAEQADVVRMDLAFINCCMPFLKKVPGGPKYYPYALAFAKHCGVSTERLLLVVSRNVLDSVNDTRIALDKLSELYNWKLSPDKRIYLRSIYEQTNSRSFGWYHPNWIAPKQLKDAVEA